MILSIFFLNIYFNNRKIYVTNTPYTTHATKRCSAHMAYCYPTHWKSWVVMFTFLTTEIKTKSWFSFMWGAAGTEQIRSSTNKNHKRKAGLTLGASIKVIPVQSSQTTRLKLRSDFLISIIKASKEIQRRRKPKWVLCVSNKILKYFI